MKIWIINNQFSRRNINNYSRIKLALELEGIFQKKAKEKMVVASHPKIDSNVGKQISAEQPYPQIKEVKPAFETRQELAKLAKVSHDTIAKVKAIEAKATRNSIKENRWRRY